MIYVCFLQLTAYGGSLAYTVSYRTDQQEQSGIRVTSEPDLIIQVSCLTTTGFAWKLRIWLRCPPHESVDFSSSSELVFSEM